MTIPRTPDTATTEPQAPRATWGEPDLTLQPEVRSVDFIGEPCTYPAEEYVRWDIGLGCMVMFDLTDESGLTVAVVTGPDFPKGGRDLRRVTTDQIRKFACQLIAFAQVADDRGVA